MDPGRLMTRTCVITKRTIPADPETDDYGNPIAEESTFTAACELQQSSRSEQTQDADWQIGDWNLFVAPTATNEADATVETELDGSDKVTVDGVAYEVVGPPWPARNPRTGVLTHIEARVRLVD